MRFPDGVLFFPVTAFRADGSVDLDATGAHVAERVGDGPGGVFAACGTGEFHALSAGEHAAVVRAAVEATAGRVPVVAGAGGPLGHAIDCVRAAEQAGADGILLLPPYLVEGPADGVVAYAEAVLAASGLPVVLYHRGAGRLTPRGVERLLGHPRVAGIKDGVGDIALAQQFVRVAAESGRAETLFFNGLLTAELSQAAYRAIGVPLYSSAVFAMAPDIATAFYRASLADDLATQHRLLDGFYRPLVALRDETPGFAVSLIKAGLRLAGAPVGSVRAPLVDPSAAQLDRLAAILDEGHRIAAA
ncbi:5-dehydro-4-deoxyglucarate dehydratase [Protaetiibacter intestinalis]|uniref:Probable 5-dehydro-4-deoxyglucarate dehydratase n=1 Tax=Protaetiibacter intestinalis TaxID=2419774 RepID=A0A387B307_9MICO|nr:5-dehydro-4-deoxyglucarate dehydratase [Protaetiibacter intestinalis]AYF97974.1 5-dehydro-4-deoxyglucarate dehydratase [Protaetiibacter intestinalis]